jgi:DNA-binding transcriptional regulator YiaG
MWCVDKAVSMTEIQRLRHQLGLSQVQMAALLRINEETYRTWDTGRRRTPPTAFASAEALVRSGQHVRLPLYKLANEYGVHVRTLRAAASDGRLIVSFESRSYFGHPVALATRSAVNDFLQGGFRKPPSAGHFRSVMVAPANYAFQIVSLRRRLRVTQTALAQRLGAANKAVIYQWETGRRRPSPVFWRRIVLQLNRLRGNFQT